MNTSTDSYSFSYIEHDAWFEADPICHINAGPIGPSRELVSVFLRPIRFFFSLACDDQQTQTINNVEIRTRFTLIPVDPILEGRDLEPISLTPFINIMLFPTLGGWTRSYDIPGFWRVVPGGTYLIRAEVIDPSISATTQIPNLVARVHTDLIEFVYDRPLPLCASTRSSAYA